MANLWVNAVSVRSTGHPDMCDMLHPMGFDCDKKIFGDSLHQKDLEGGFKLSVSHNPPELTDPSREGDVWPKHEVTLDHPEVSHRYSQMAFPRMERGQQGQSPSQLPSFTNEYPDVHTGPHAAQAANTGHVASAETDHGEHLPHIIDKMMAHPLTRQALDSTYAASKVDDPKILDQIAMNHQGVHMKFGPKGNMTSLQTRSPANGIDSRYGNPNYKDHEPTDY